MYNQKNNVQHDKCNELFLYKKMHLKWRGRYNSQSPSLLFHAQLTFPLIDQKPVPVICSYEANNIQHNKYNELFLCKKMHLKWRGHYNSQSPSLICHAQLTFPLIEKGTGGSISQVVGLPNNSYKPITKTACVRARFCRLQKRVHSEPQVIKFTSCLSMPVSGSPRVLRLLPLLKLVAMIQLKYY